MTVEILSNEAAGLRLVPFRESGEYIGIKSPTTLYKLVSNGELPEPIKRGTRSFFLERDLITYITKLVERRGPQMQAAEHEAGKQAADRMLAGKRNKAAAAQKRKAVQS